MATWLQNHPMFHLALGFRLLIMWPCSFSMEEVGFVFLPLESGLALELALANRMWWKWRFPAPRLWFRGPCVLLSLSFCHNHNPSWPAAGQGTDRRVLCGPRSISPLLTAHTREPCWDLLCLAQISRIAWLTHRLKRQEQMSTIVPSWGLVGGCLAAVSVAIDNGHRQFCWNWIRVLETPWAMQQTREFLKQPDHVLLSRCTEFFLGFFGHAAASEILAPPRDQSQATVLKATES